MTDNILTFLETWPKWFEDWDMPQAAKDQLAGLITLRRAELEARKVPDDVLVVGEHDPDQWAQPANEWAWSIPVRFRYRIIQQEVE